MSEPPTEKSKKSPCRFFSNPSENCELTDETCERAHSQGIVPVNDPCYILEMYENERKKKI